jgi:hypothetical protein
MRPFALNKRSGKFNAIKVYLIKDKLYECDKFYIVKKGDELWTGQELIGKIEKSFDSRKEAHYYYKIINDPDIDEVILQPRFELQPMFKKDGVTHRSIVYVADFEIHYKNGEVAIIDTKGMMTREFQMKKKMFEYKYPDLKLVVI